MISQCPTHRTLSSKVHWRNSPTICWRVSYPINTKPLLCREKSLCIGSPPYNAFIFMEDNKHALAFLGPRTNLTFDTVQWRKLVPKTLLVAKYTSVAFFALLLPQNRAIVAVATSSAIGITSKAASSDYAHRVMSVVLCSKWVNINHIIGIEAGNAPITCWTRLPRFCRVASLEGVRIQCTSLINFFVHPTQRREGLSAFFLCQMVYNWTLIFAFKNPPAIGTSEPHPAPQKHSCWILDFVGLHSILTVTSLSNMKECCDQR